MVNIEIKTNVSNIIMKYKDEETKDLVTFFSYPNGFEIKTAIISGVEYELDEEYIINVGYEQVVRNLKTNRKLGKNQKQVVLEKINKIVKNGNEYFNTIKNISMVNLY